MTAAEPSQRLAVPSPGARVRSTGELRVVDPAERDALVPRLAGADSHLCAAYHAASALPLPDDGHLVPATSGPVGAGSTAAPFSFPDAGRRGRLSFETESIHHVGGAVGRAGVARCHSIA